MEREALKSYLQQEESAFFQGWDFSRLEGRWRSEEPDWDYRTVLMGRLRPTDRLLDMGTGGGEVLMSLGHPHHLTSVTEGYGPNADLCRARLAPLGIQVEEVDGADKLPFKDSSFDVAANRHESFDVEEVYRVLRPGGYFVTQQVGGQNNCALSSRLIPGFNRPFLLFSDMQRKRNSADRMERYIKSTVGPKGSK